MGALTELNQACLIGGVGAKINQSSVIPRYLDLVDGDFFVVVMPNTLLDTDNLDREFSLTRNEGLVIGDLFVRGILATGTMPDMPSLARSPFGGLL